MIYRSNKTAAQLHGKPEFVIETAHVATNWFKLLHTDPQQSATKDINCDNLCATHKAFREKPKAERIET